MNRWAHGYSYSPGLLWEPKYASEEDKPWVKGRKPFGRITIANSDAGAAANTNSAITHGISRGPGSTRKLILYVEPAFTFDRRKGEFYSEVSDV